MAYIDSYRLLLPFPCFSSGYINDFHHVTCITFFKFKSTSRRNWSSLQLLTYEDIRFHFVIVILYFINWYKHKKDSRGMHLDIPQFCYSHQGPCLCLKLHLIENLCMWTQVGIVR